MLILILQLIALFLVIVSGFSFFWLIFINHALNSLMLTRRWQEHAVPQTKNLPIWGKVFESITYKPIAGAVIKMYDAETSKRLAITTTDSEGCFGFNTPDGKFFLRINAFYHSFPSELLIKRYKPQLARRRKKSDDYFGLFLPEIHDKNFENIYFGEIINNKSRTLQRIFASKSEVLKGIERKAPIILNIPVDKEEILTLDKETLRSITNQEKAFNAVKLVCLIVGFTVVLVTLIIAPNIVSLIILELFLVFTLYVLFERLKQRYHGVVTDKRNKPLRYALVRARGYMTKQIRASAITNSEGKFVIPLYPGWYTFEISRDHFKSERKLIKCDKKPKEQKIEFSLERKLP